MRCKNYRALADDLVDTTPPNDWVSTLVKDREDDDEIVADERAKCLCLDPFQVKYSPAMEKRKPGF